MKKLRNIFNHEAQRLNYVQEAQVVGPKLVKDHVVFTDFIARGHLPKRGKPLTRRTTDHDVRFDRKILNIRNIAAVDIVCKIPFVSSAACLVEVDCVNGVESGLLKAKGEAAAPGEQIHESVARYGICHRQSSPRFLHTYPFPGAE
jgi:hypothetical protein